MSETRHRYYCSSCQCGLGGDLDNPAADYKVGIYDYQTGITLCGDCWRAANGIEHVEYQQAAVKKARKAATIRVQGQLSLWEEAS